jgi:hypothetical protein
MIIRNMQVKYSFGLEILYQIFGVFRVAIAVNSRNYINQMKNNNNRKLEKLISSKRFRKRN